MTCPAIKTLSVGQPSFLQLWSSGSLWYSQQTLKRLQQRHWNRWCEKKLLKWQQLHHYCKSNPSSSHIPSLRRALDADALNSAPPTQTTRTPTNPNVESFHVDRVDYKLSVMAGTSSTIKGSLTSLMAGQLNQLHHWGHICWMINDFSRSHFYLIVNVSSCRMSHKV